MIINFPKPARNSWVLQALGKDVAFDQLPGDLSPAFEEDCTPTWRYDWRSKKENVIILVMGRDKSLVKEGAIIISSIIPGSAGHEMPGSIASRFNRATGALEEMRDAGALDYAGLWWNGDQFLFTRE